MKLGRIVGHRLQELGKQLSGEPPLEAKFLQELGRQHEALLAATLSRIEATRPIEPPPAPKQTAAEALAMAKVQSSRPDVVGASASQPAIHVTADGLPVKTYDASFRVEDVVKNDGDGQGAYGDIEARVTIDGTEHELSAVDDQVRHQLVELTLKRYSGPIRLQGLVVKGEYGAKVVKLAGFEVPSKTFRADLTVEDDDYTGRRAALLKVRGKQLELHGVTGDAQRALEALTQNELPATGVVVTGYRGKTDEGRDAVFVRSIDLA